MKCPAAIRLLDAYVDDELEVSGVLVLEDHLRECSRCRAREESLRALRSALQAHTEYRMAPAGLRGALRARLGVRAAPPPSRRRFTLGVAALGAIAAVSVIGWQAGIPGTNRSAGKKVIYHFADSRTAGAGLRTLRNHLEATPSLQVVVVAHNEGVDFLLRGARDESGQLFEASIRGLRERGVDFRVCTNTLVRRKIEATGIVPGATLVPSGIAEIGRLQQEESYGYIRL